MVTLKHIQEAKARIAPHILETPVIRMENLDEQLGCKVYVKAECLQRTNSFKIRGALNKMLSMGPEKLKGGVVAASSGNHGKGVAFAARLMGLKATIVIPETAPQVKADGILALGAEVVKCKLSERHAIAKQLSEQQGLTIIHPYDDYDVIAGQGTVGMEIMAAIPDLDCVVVPIGGGGLIGGISTAVKAINPKVRVVGAEPAAMPRYTRSVAAGRRVVIDESPCIADALLTLQPGEKNFPIFQSNVDELVAVKDEFIILGMKALLFEGRLLAEPSSAVGIGAALQGDLKLEREDKVCFVISGGSVGPSQVMKILGGSSC